MSIVKMKGIIIAENNMGDFDKMLTMLTPRCSEKFRVWQREQGVQKALFWLAHNFYALENM